MEMRARERRNLVERPRGARRRPSRRAKHLVLGEPMTRLTLSPATNSRRCYHHASRAVPRLLPPSQRTGRRFVRVDAFRSRHGRVRCPTQGAPHRLPCQARDVDRVERRGSSARRSLRRLADDRCLMATAGWQSCVPLTSSRVDTPSRVDASTFAGWSWRRRGRRGAERHGNPRTGEV